MIIKREIKEKKDGKVTSIKIKGFLYMIQAGLVYIIIAFSVFYASGVLYGILTSDRIEERKIGTEENKNMFVEVTYLLEGNFKVKKYRDEYKIIEEEDVEI